MTKIERKGYIAVILPLVIVLIGVMTFALVLFLNVGAARRETKSYYSTVVFIMGGNFGQVLWMLFSAVALLLLLLKRQRVAIGFILTSGLCYLLHQLATLAIASGHV